MSLRFYFKFDFVTFNDQICAYLLKIWLYNFQCKLTQVYALHYTVVLCQRSHFMELTVARKIDAEFLIQTIGFYLYLFISLFHMTCKFWRYKELVWHAYTKKSMSVKMKLFDNVFNIIGSAFILNIFKHVLNLENSFRLFFTHE